MWVLSWCIWGVVKYVYMSYAYETALYTLFEAIGWEILEFFTSLFVCNSFFFSSIFLWSSAVFLMVDIAVRIYTSIVVLFVFVF